MPGTFSGATRATSISAARLGRAEGDTIVQQGVDARGSSVRWSFFRITENSFRWLGECLHDGGTDWRLEVEFLARRVTRPDQPTICKHGENYA